MGKGEMPRADGMVWLEQPGGICTASFNRRLRLQTMTGTVDGQIRYMGGVVASPGQDMQAAAFCALDLADAKLLAYQLAILIAPHFPL